MNTKYGKLVQLSSGWCQDCSSRIEDTTWCFVNGTSTVEARHIVEAGLLTQKELDDRKPLAQGLSAFFATVFERDLPESAFF